MVHYCWKPLGCNWITSIITRTFIFTHFSCCTSYCTLLYQQILGMSAFLWSVYKTLCPFVRHSFCLSVYSPWKPAENIAIKFHVWGIYEQLFSSFHFRLDRILQPPRYVKVYSFLCARQRLHWRCLRVIVLFSLILPLFVGHKGTNHHEH